MFDELKKIIEIQNNVSEVIPFQAIDEDSPILAVRSGKLVGMVVCEDGKWFVRIGRVGSVSVCGTWDNLRTCLRSAAERHYSFYTASVLKLEPCQTLTQGKEA